MSLFLFIPNTHNIFGFVVHDFFIIIILLYFIISQKIKRLPEVLIAYSILLFAMMLAIVAQRQLENWLFLVRLMLYFSLPIMFTLRLSTINKIIIISMTTVILVIDYLQLHQGIFNPFMFAYYLRARDLEITFYRYAFFDEHFALTPVLMFVSILILKRFPVILTIFVAWYFNSRMVLLTLIPKCFRGVYTIFYILLLVAAVLLILILVDHRSIEGLYLRFDNWKAHISCLQKPVDVIFGASRACYENISVPIDNFLVRILSKTGVVGLVITTLILGLSARTKASLLLLLAFLSMNLVNDLITYPSILLAFVITLTFVNNHELRARS